TCVRLVLIFRTQRAPLETTGARVRVSGGLGPNSSAVEHFLGKEEVSGSIPDLGSTGEPPPAQHPLVPIPIPLAPFPAPSSRPPLRGSPCFRSPACSFSALFRAFWTRPDRPAPSIRHFSGLFGFFSGRSGFFMPGGLVP